MTTGQSVPSRRQALVQQLGAAPGHADIRRGALVGLAAGVPLYSALLALCLLTGRSPVYTASFATLLLTIVTIAVVRLLHRPER